MFLKQIFVRGSEASRANMLLSLLFTTKFSSARQFKNHIELFSTFLDESRQVKSKI